MAQWEGKSKGNKTGYRIFVSLIRNFGVKPAYLLLRLVVPYYLLFSPASTRVMIRFYNELFGAGFFRARYLVYRNYLLLGQVLIDRIALMSGSKTDFTFTFDGEEHLREMIQRRQGGLLLGGHMGNWESAGHLLKRLNTPIHIVMYDGEDARLREYLDGVTGPRNFNIILVRDDLSHVYRISEAVAQGHLVCIHADRFRPGNKTLAGDFFGKTARFPEGPFLLASKLRIPTAFVYAFKDSSTHYHLYSTPVMQFDSSKGDRPESILAGFTRSLENMVKRYPEQWFNYYNFWA